MTAKQTKRTDNALLESWSTPEGEVRSLDWFSHTSLSQTMPAQLAAEVTTVALDWTAIPTWAVTRDHRKEEEVRKQQTPENTGAIGTLEFPRFGRLVWLVGSWPPPLTWGAARGSPRTLRSK